MSLTVRSYAEADLAVWNAFVARSRNGTFLFDRNYMDYHAARFVDASLIVLSAGIPLALLPASRHGSSIISHAGLTYGGFVIDEQMTASRMADVFHATLQHYSASGVRRLLYKTVPPIYHRVPSEEDRYSLFRAGALLVRRDVLAVVDNCNPLRPQERRRRGARKAARFGLHVQEDNDWEAFWQLLASRLGERHGTTPVHSIDEIRLLAGRFPHQIRLFSCRSAASLLAGVVVYETNQVAHAQYVAASAEGRQCGAQDLLFADLLERFSYLRWFDFGISTERNGAHLNDGLMAYKEGFGARAVMHDFYELALPASVAPHSSS